MKNKKRWISLLLIFCMIFSVTIVFAEDISAAEENKGINFADVPETHKAYEAVSYLAEREIINGKSKLEFDPDGYLKREEFAKVLVNAFKLPSNVNENILYDVPAGTWYVDYVHSVAASGLMMGISENQFGIGMNLSREDLAVILKRFLDDKGVNLEKDKTIIYSDNNEISEYARESVEALIAAGIVDGRENNTWQPREYATRSEAAMALYGALMAMEKHIALLGRYADVSQYDPPYDVPEDDRIAEAMPMPFDANIWPKLEIASIDFESTDYGVLKLEYQQGDVKFDSNGGIDDSKCIKIVGTEGLDSVVKFLWNAIEGEDVTEGDYLVFSCMIKGEGISGGGKYRNLLQIYDDKGKWLDETHTFKQKVDTEWTEYQQILQVPEGVNELTTRTGYKIYLTAQHDNLSGTVWFDNFKLYKIKFDPMDTVLMTPNYKGIIKGEGGIGDITLRAYVNELNGMYDLDNIGIMSQITDEEHNVLMQSKSDIVTNANDICFSSKDLEMNGDYWLETYVYDKTTGEQLDMELWTLHKKPEDFQTVIGYDEYGRLTENGEPYLPVAITNYDSYDDAIADMLEAGCIDSLRHSGMGWYYNFSKPEYQERIKKLDDAGMKIDLATGTVNFSNLQTGEVKRRVKEQKDIRGLLTKIVNNFKDLPNLLTYKTSDEENGTRFGNEMAWVRMIIEDLDLDHPTTGGIDNLIPFRPGVYAKTSDILLIDPYPVTGKADQDISIVYERMEQLKRLNPNRPVGAILQAFYYNTRGDLRGPTTEEYRNMMFQALCGGSCMISSFAYAWMKQVQSPGKTFEEEWESAVQVMAEVDYLKPIYLSAEPTPYYEVKGGDDWFNHMSRRYDGKSYFFAVNNESTGKTARVHLDGVKTIKSMYTDEILTADSNGWFSIQMDGYGVDVFEYEQADYKSPHAELMHFGISDLVFTDAEEETTTVQASETTGVVQYKARISDNAVLYINGEQADESGQLDITGLSEITVKVVSEDGRFKTEKKYIITRS